MNQPKPFDPNDVLKAVKDSAVIFLRDTVEHLPSGDEVRQLMAKGKKWRFVVAGYLNLPGVEPLSVFASTNEAEPPEEWFKKAREVVIMQLTNVFLRRLRENATKLVVPEESGKIVVAK